MSNVEFNFLDNFLLCIGIYDLGYLKEFAQLAPITQVH